MHVGLMCIYSGSQLVEDTDDIECTLQKEKHLTGKSFKVLFDFLEKATLLLNCVNKEDV